jgi:hypothetical protein
MVTVASIFRDARPGRADRVRVSPAPTIAIRPPIAAVPPTLDGRLIAILDAPLASGETAMTGYQRKEHELGAVFASLSVLDARAMHARLSACKAADELAHKFARLTLERRTRLLDFLANARRREARAGR